jgi:Na+-transporting NADH:ubiquinone oxidoreductase subunit NqrB
MDPRWWQLGSQVVLLVFGVLAQDHSIEISQIAFAIVAAMSTQFVCSKVVGLEKINLLSPLSTAFSLGILLRSDNLWIHPLAAFLSIGSKFTFRIKGDHFINPSVFGITAVLLLTDNAWFSPGHWGQNLILFFWIALISLTLIRRSTQADLTFSFLGALFIFQLVRILYLGDRFEVLLHQFEQGALMVFAFSMITDPKTTPMARTSRIIFASAAAGVTFYLQHWYFLAAAPVYALLAVAPLVPLMNHTFPALRFHWRPTPHKLPAPSREPELAA